MPTPKVLVVDDSRTLRTQLKRVLSEAGCEVVLAAGGQEGIQRAMEERPQLLVLDIQMPDVDGYAVCQELQRKGPPWDQLPVIFLTSLESHALELLGSKLGAYLHKPVRRESLLQAVRGFLPELASDETVLAAAQTDSSPRPLATP